MNRRKFLSALAVAVGFCRGAWENRKTWRCSWCGHPSHEPAPNELIVCPKCGTAGVTDAELRTGPAYMSVDEFGRRYLEPAARVLRDAIERDLFNQYLPMNGYTNTVPFRKMRIEFDPARLPV